MVKIITREWTSREMTNRESRTYSCGPAFLLRGVIESTARYSDRPPSPQHDHPS
jgi:hypothetical protein